MRRTLVDLIRNDIGRSGGPQISAPGPDWPRVVEDAVLRQDMEWVLDQCGETAVTLAVSTDDERGVWVSSSRSVR